MSQCQTFLSHVQGESIFAFAVLAAGCRQLVIFGLPHCNCHSDLTGKFGISSIIVNNQEFWMSQCSPGVLRSPPLPPVFTDRSGAHGDRHLQRHSSWKRRDRGREGVVRLAAQNLPASQLTSVDVTWPVQISTDGIKIHQNDLKCIKHFSILSNSMLEKKLQSLPSKCERSAL